MILYPMTFHDSSLSVALCSKTWIIFSISSEDNFQDIFRISCIFTNLKSWTCLFLYFPCLSTLFPLPMTGALYTLLVVLEGVYASGCGTCMSDHGTCWRLTSFSCVFYMCLLGGNSFSYSACTYSDFPRLYFWSQCLPIFLVVLAVRLHLLVLV